MTLPLPAKTVWFKSTVASGKCRRSLWFSFSKTTWRLKCSPVTSQGLNCSISRSYSILSSKICTEAPLHGWTLRRIRPKDKDMIGLKGFELPPLPRWILRYTRVVVFFAVKKEDLAAGDVNDAITNLPSFLSVANVYPHCSEILPMSEPSMDVIDLPILLEWTSTHLRTWGPSPMLMCSRDRGSWIVGVVKKKLII